MPLNPAGVPSMAAIQDAIDEAVAAVGTYQPYTPIWTAATTPPDVGNGTLEGTFTRVSDFVQFQIELILGTTSNIGAGAYEFSLPLAVQGAKGAMGVAIIRSPGGTRTAGIAYYNTATTVRILVASTNNQFTAATVALADGWRISIEGSYRAVP